MCVPRHPGPVKEASVAPPEEGGKRQAACRRCVGGGRRVAPQAGRAKG